MSMRTRLILLFTAASAIAACGNDDGSNVPADAGVAVCPDPTFSSIYSNVLNNARCTACHFAATPNFGNLGFGAGKDAAYTALQGASFNPKAGQAMLVVAGQPANSFLYVKVTDPNSPDGLMPLGGMLTACETQAIQTWIMNGAAND